MKNPLGALGGNPQRITPSSLWGYSFFHLCGWRLRLGVSELSDSASSFTVSFALRVRRHRLGASCSSKLPMRGHWRKWPAALNTGVEQQSPVGVSGVEFIESVVNGSPICWHRVLRLCLSYSPVAESLTVHASPLCRSLRHRRHCTHAARVRSRRPISELIVVHSPIPASHHPRPERERLHVLEEKVHRVHWARRAAWVCG